jgi:hypothetical protein
MSEAAEEAATEAAVTSAIDVALAEESKPLEDKIPESEPLVDESEAENTGKMVAEETTEEETAAEEDTLAAELKSMEKEKPSTKKKERNKKVKTTELEDPQRRAEFMAPRMRSANPVSRLARAIGRALKYSYSSTSALPKEMTPAALVLSGARGKVTEGYVQMARFGERLELLLRDEGHLQDDIQRETMHRAIVARIEGMRPSSVKNAFGVTPSKAVEELLGEYVPIKNALSAEYALAESGQTTLKSSIRNNGDTWLHKSTMMTPAIMNILRGVGGKNTITSRMTPQERDAVMVAALKAYSLPATTAEYELMPIEFFRDLIGENRPFRADEEGGQYVLKGVTVFDKEGNPRPKKGNVRVKKATKDQLSEWISRQAWDEEAITNFTMGMINMVNKPKSGHGRKTAKADVSDTSASMRRKLLLSQRQQIEKMMDVILKTDILDEEGRKGFKAKKDDYRSLNRAEFVEEMGKIDPQLRPLVERSAANYELWDTVRATLGEITDPALLMQDSVVRLNSTIEMAKSFSRIVEMGILSGRLSVDPKTRKEGTHEYALDVKYTKVPWANDQGISSIGDVRFNLGKTTYKGSEVYGDKETIISLQQLMNARANVERGGAANFLYRMSALAKYDKVVLNPFAHFRNGVGTFAIGASRGVIGTSANPLVAAFTGRGSFMTGARLAKAEATAVVPWGKDQKAKAAEQFIARPEIETLAEEMAKRGVNHDSVRQGALADIFTHLAGLSDNEYNNMMASGLTVSRREAGTNLQSAANKMTQFANEMFRLEDEAIKGVAFLQRTRQHLALTAPELDAKAESSDILNTYMNPETRDNLSTEELERITTAMDFAGENVLQTFPTFSRAPQFIKALSRHPVLGAFPTFQAEMVRNHFNHTKFGLELMFKPDAILGESYTPKQRAKATALGFGLLLQQFVSVGAQTVGIGAINSLTKQGEGDDKKKTREEIRNSSTKLVLNAAANSLDSYNVYKFRNVMASWLEGTNMMIMPSSIDPVNNRGKFSWVNMGWSSPEGALIEAGYGFANDIAELASMSDLTDEMKLEVGMAIARSMASHMAGIFGNEEVLFRDIFKYYDEGDYAPVKGKLNAQLGRGTNQFMRSLFDPETNVLNRASASEGGPVGKTTAALTAALVKNIPPMTALAQAGEVVNGTIDHARMSQNPEEFWTKVGVDVATTMSGIRYEEYDFLKDYPTTLQYTHSRRLKDSSVRMINELFSPNKTYTEKAFKRTYAILDRYRRQDVDNISNAVQLGHDKLGVSMDEIADNLQGSVWG